MLCNPTLRPTHKFLHPHVFSATEASWPADGTVEFMMNLPTAIEPDMTRKGTPLGPAAAAAAASDCLRSCNGNAACMSWNFDRYS